MTHNKSYSPQYAPRFNLETLMGNSGPSSKKKHNDDQAPQRRRDNGVDFALFAYVSAPPSYEYY